MVSLISDPSFRDSSSALSIVERSSKLTWVLLVLIADLKALYSLGSPLRVMWSNSSSSTITPTAKSLSLTTFIFYRYESTESAPFLILWSSPLRFITCDLEMEENLFSRTFQTFNAEEHPTVSARIEGVSVELKKVSKAFSFDFQIKKSGFTTAVYDPERSLRNWSGINCGSSINSKSK